MKIDLSKGYDNNSYKIVNTGSGPLGLLGVSFVILKILGYINWPWWAVLTPFWISFSIVIILLIMVSIIATCIKDDNPTDNSNSTTIPNTDTKFEESTVKLKKKTSRKKENKEVTNEGNNTGTEENSSK